ncbi:MAG: hypothetical protein DRP01_07020 [Archaeoglobales archaeon]|nr:MAG: hypothetical protein DRP01_07020 [Archaeoglobales archaeon]
MNADEVLTTILEAVKEKPLTIEDLKRKTETDERAVVEAVKFLEKFGFITTSENRVSITEAGKEFLKLPV